ncbi:putative TIM17-mitochondrial inner membrane import translocase subunit [Mrakia frigida]|uniref:protein transporter TIM17 n=1 Tax=Mrakia frigida TaxID=29902 RepID=UPI003FCC09CB
MSHGDHTRDPCPWVILNDFGGAFAMGLTGGAIWHGVKGAKSSPKGTRWRGSMAAARARAPVVGGNFGIWGGLFSTYDCSIKSYRGKEDAWNAIGAGFMVGGTLAIRQGWKSALGGAITCGILLGVIEGAGALMQRMMFSDMSRPQMPPMPEAPAAIAA